MSHIGEFDLIGRIAAACHNWPSCLPEARSCLPEARSCHPEARSCHPERSEGSGVLGIGDDCAVLPQRDGVDTLVTTDLLIEGRHFLLDDVTPYELGWKSAAVNISDIAAMGGKPVASFLSIALPKDLPVPSGKSAENVDGREENGVPSGKSAPNVDGREENGVPSGKSADNPDGGCNNGLPSGKMASNPDGVAEWVDQFIAGFNEMSGRFGVRLLGGDTSASDDKLFINVTVLGECPHGQAILRSGARPGDLICVTGCLGDSAAGLKLILERAGGHKMPEQGLAPPDLRSAHPSVPLGPTIPLHPQGTGGVPPETPCLDKLWWAPPVHVATGGHGSPGPTHAPADILIRRHYLPMPRVEFGQQLAATPGVHAMMDISDGIASDLHHILNASSSSPDADWARSRFNPDTLPGNMHSTPFYGTSPGKVPASKLDLAQVPVDNDRLCALSAEIDLKALPMSEELKTVCAERGWDAAELAVSGGEDYELLFTVAPGTELPEGCTVIGRIVDSRSEPGMTGGMSEPGMRCEEPGMTGGMSEPGMTGDEPVPGIRWIGSDKDFKGFTHF